jgi:hypothetical protein
VVTKDVREKNCDEISFKYLTLISFYHHEVIIFISNTPCLEVDFAINIACLLSCTYCILYILLFLYIFFLCVYI